MNGMADGVENGPSNHNGDSEQVWERPWTLDEMRKTSANWSLAADSGLFLFLQDFSQRMLSKTHDIEKQLDGLIRDTKATDSCLQTVFNDFLMLSNTQFIENRVYDEEVEDPVSKPEALERPPEQEKTREQKEAELIPKVQEAVNYGLRVLESAFEQLDIKAGNSDSEDEEATDRVEPILEPKDLYVDRPLPYLIGSQLFMQQDDVGLGDLSSDEMSIDSDRDSVIESEEGKDGDESDEDFDQDEEGQGSFKKKSSMLSDEEDEEDEEEDSDIFGESDKDEDRKNSAGPSSFADELAARIKGETASKSEADRTSLSSAPSTTTKKTSKGRKEPKPQVEDDDDKLFKPPEMEDEDYSPFGGRGGLFSGGKGLFDDDDEGDLFSDAPKQEAAKRGRNAAHPAEPVKSKKIPSGAVSIFPENRLFGSPNDSDSVKNRENGSPVKPKLPAAPKRASIGGGLFDEDEEDDDFFSGKSLTSSSAGQEKPKPKKTVDLFGGDEDDDEEEGDIFSESSSAAAPPPKQSTKEVVEEDRARPPEKKRPAGAVSMFGPGTQSLLVEGLKKRRPSTNEESDKSEEAAPPPDLPRPSAAKAAEKAPSRGLFSAAEHSQIFPTKTKSQSKPEPPTQSRASKAPLSIFDDDEEEDLFASAAKSKSNQAKPATQQAKKPVSSSLFSEDEDQWMSSKPSTAKPEVNSRGMKASTSAPSSLPSVKAPKKDGLFGRDDNDLFTATKESSQKKPQRVSLMFEDEDEDDEDKGSLFGFKPAVSKTTPDVKVSAVASQAPSLFDREKAEEVVDSPAAAVEEKVAVETTPAGKSPGVPSSPEQGSEPKRKPAGAVGLLGGVSVLGDRQGAVKTKSPLDDDEEDELYNDGPPPMESKNKVKKTTLSLFDKDEEEEEEEDTVPVSISIIPAAKNTLKEDQARTKSTGVFQDEDLLFSHTQQRDNDPDVDLFSTAAKSAAPLPSSGKLAAPALFGDEDEDDLFSSSKPKARPKAPEKPSKPKKEESSVKPKNTAASTGNEKPASPVKAKEPSSRIGKLQANLGINPTSLLPGAAPRVPGLAPSPSHASPAGTPEPQTPTEGGVSFDSPAQASTLQSANKGRTKGSVRRRPQTRAARHLAAQVSEEHREESLEERAANGAGRPATHRSLPNPNPAPAARVEPSPATSPTLPGPVSTRPSVLTLPVTTSVERDPAGAVRPKRPPAAKEDIFGSDDLFAPASKHTPSPKPKTKTSEEGPSMAPKKEPSRPSKKEVAPSIFDGHGGDLFQAAKQAKKAKAAPFQQEDGDDIFGTGRSSTAAVRSDTKAGSSSAKQDIFQDEIEAPSKAPKKPKEKALDSSLFDDNVDIFADLTAAAKPKEKKSKKKVKTKSIFDDDTDDIFSSGSAKRAAKIPSSKSKQPQPAQEPNSAEDTGHSIFDDPLNVLGGN